jgi:hypothetical protein
LWVARHEDMREFMIPCELKNPAARNVVANVWRYLRKNFPNDACFLARIVTSISPLSEDEAGDGTQGRWRDEGFKNYDDQEIFFSGLGKEHGQTYGRILLLDTSELTVGTVAHELGHAFTSSIDLANRRAPTDEWASEAAADMHAVLWGLLTVEEIQLRYRNNVSFAQEQTMTHEPAWMHHGPPPGMDWVEIYGYRWRLRTDFVFERLYAVIIGS